MLSAAVVLVGVHKLEGRSWTLCWFCPLKRLWMHLQVTGWHMVLWGSMTIEIVFGSFCQNWAKTCPSSSYVDVEMGSNLVILTDAIKEALDGHWANLHHGLGATHSAQYTLCNESCERTTRILVNPFQLHRSQIVTTKKVTKRCQMVMSRVVCNP